MPSLKHEHIYKKREKAKGYYFCIHPKCTHYAPKDLLEGKLATCPDCFEPFKIQSKDLRLERIFLRCQNCKSRKKNSIGKIFLEPKSIEEKLLSFLNKKSGEEDGD